jgi:TolA-binding protein
MMLWVFGGIVLALVALGAKLFADYRLAAVELVRLQHAAAQEANALVQRVDQLKAEIPMLEAAMAQLEQERANINKELDWERQNFDELSKRHKLRHVGRQKLDRDSID